MAKPPLLVHLLFHPLSASARELARHIHHQLNDDVIVPGLRVPTTFCSYSGAGLPPELEHFPFAERSFLAVLGDDRLNIDDEWCRFVADVSDRCEGTRHRFVPIQLDRDAWPLDDRLQGVSFARAYLHPEGEARNAFVVRRLVIELCRYLLHETLLNDESRVPVEIFLSHTKLDLDAPPKVMQQLMAHLTQAQPVDTWIDSGDISAGSRFGVEIAGGVKRTALLVVLTDNYATREWCRREVLLAKEYQRPVAVIDALSRYEARSFPYLGNLPRIRWDGDPAKGVDLLLKEMLRQLHMELVLENVRQADDVVFVRPPELATLIGVADGKHVLYPDPPVGAEESVLLSKTSVPFTTPLRRMAQERPLNGRLIALSMSESTDIQRFGLDNVHLERAMLELSRYLLIQGATLAYGGHLGSAGYTEKLFELVRAHNDSDAHGAIKRIVNHRGWPLPRLSVRKRSELKAVATVIELPRPAGIDETMHADFKADPEWFGAEKSAAHRFAWARGMTEMRAFQADAARSQVCARIVLGGTFGPTVKARESGESVEQWYSGRMPGVLEEVLLSAKAGQPVFLIGAFGGAARLVIDLLHGQVRPEATWEYQTRAPFAPEMKAIYDRQGLEWEDYDEVARFLRSRGADGLNPLLTDDENEELFETTDPVRMVELVLTGLGKL
jgi:hypothetical protein